MRHTLSPTALALALTLMTPLAAGAQGQSPAGVDERLAFLEERLDASQRHGKLWHWGWLGVSAGGAVGGVAGAATQNGDDQAARIVQAATGTIGVGYVLLRPLEARLGADPIRAMPSATEADRENQLRAAEAMLERTAERASERMGWKMHAANLAFNLAAGGFVVGFGNLGDAGILAASGSLAGAFQLWSEPSRPQRDWEDYQAFKATGARATPSAWSIAPRPGGLAFEMRF